MKKSIGDIPYEELKKDYNDAIHLEKLVRELESKYEELLGRPVTLYSVKNSILQELGRRDLNK